VNQERDVSAKRRLRQNLNRWKKVRQEIHQDVCQKGFDKKLNSFVQYYGAKTLDASCLRIALVGFLPPDDPRIIGTVEAIGKHLMPNGFVQRYDPGKTDDGLSGGEGAFLACSFWMVANLWLLGRHTDARELFERLLSLRNDVGLLSEEYDWKRTRMLGNFPQALSHISLVHAAFTISGLWTPKYTRTGATTPGGAVQLQHRSGNGPARSATKEGSRAPKI
jgi:GH15 family glucan-1,4-alpha-glucosidase